MNWQWEGQRIFDWRYKSKRAVRIKDDRKWDMNLRFGMCSDYRWLGGLRWLRWWRPMSWKNHSCGCWGGWENGDQRESPWGWSWSPSECAAVTSRLSGTAVRTGGDWASKNWRVWSRRKRSGFKMATESKEGSYSLHALSYLKGRGENQLSFFWLCCVFIAARRPSLVVASRCYSSLRCVGFSLQWLLFLRSTGSRNVGLSSCGSRAPEHRLSSSGAQA